MQTIPEKRTSLRRRFELDWLRVATIGVMFFFHSARFFDADGWHLKNGQQSAVASFFVDLTIQWMMPLFFFISGASVWFSLRQRNAGRYLGERVTRLLVPFVFGTLVLIPPQVYLERLSQGQFTGSFLAFYPHYFEGWYGFGGNFAWMGLHLWYLEVLFVFSLVTFPLFLLLSRRSDSGPSNGPGSLFRSTWAIYLVALPIAALEIALHGSALGRKDFGGWNLFAYLVVFTAGFVLYSNNGGRETIRHQRWISLALALTCFCLLLNWRLQGGVKGYPWIEDFVRGCHSWFVLLAIVGFALEHLYFPSDWLAALNELVMPFYILHQTVILLVGYYIIGLPLPILPKFVLVCLSAGTTILLLVAIIAQSNVLRVLFGMGLARREASMAADATSVPSTSHLQLNHSRATAGAHPIHDTHAS
jgi:glucans biosynthesis protein C